MSRQKEYNILKSNNWYFLENDFIVTENYLISFKKKTIDKYKEKEAIKELRKILEDCINNNNKIII